MKKAPILFALFCFFSFYNCQNSNSKKAVEDASQLENDQEFSHLSSEHFLKNFSGKIGEIPINMTLTNWGDGFLSGHYSKFGNHKKIELSGELINDTEFEMTAYNGETEVGKFIAEIKSKDQISGIWSSLDESEILKFEVLADPIPKEDIWSGNWYLNEVWDGGLLLLGNLRQDSIDFALSIFRSGHNGIAEGLAIISGNQARFYSNFFDEEEGCELVFQHLGDHINLEQKGSNFACGFGMRAYAGGRYDQQPIEKKAVLNVGLEKENVFQNQAQHDQFKTLVGEYAYDLFAFNFQNVDLIEPKEVDTFATTCHSGFVQGLFSVNEAIIMQNKEGGIWAATIDIDTSTNEFILRYFSNSQESQNKLPSTIEEWRENFREYQIVYENQVQ